MPISTSVGGKGNNVNVVDNRSENFDQKVVTDTGLAVGAGASFSDSSQTFVDESDSSVSMFNSGNTSKTVINETDNRQTFIDSSDRRVFTDNSTNYTLDADVAQSAINAALTASVRAGEYNALVAQNAIDNNSEVVAELARLSNERAEAERLAAFGLVGDGIDFVEDSLGLVLARSAEEAENLREFQSGFIGDFYESQQDSSERITSDVLDTLKKLGFVALAVVAVRSFARS
jgi:hypothetical protein